MFHPWPTSRHPVARQQRLEVAAGLVSFSTVIASINAPVAELRGRSAVTEVLILVVLVSVLGMTLLGWHRSRWTTGTTAQRLAAGRVAAPAAGAPGTDARP